MKAILNRFMLSMVPLLLMTSCLFENDMSYPQVESDILSFEVDEQISVHIDNVENTIELVMEESADLSHVKVKSIVVSEGAELVGGVPEFMDLRRPVSLFVKVFEDEEWKISATQTIERYIEVENQIGEAEFDVPNRSAIVYVSEDQPLKQITFKSMKLEKEGSVVVSSIGVVSENEITREETVPCEFPMILECVLLRKFIVESEGSEYEWIVRVLKKEVELEMTSVNAWATHAGVTARYDGSGEPFLEYRETGATTWVKVVGANVTKVGVSAEITGLKPDTEYEVRVVNGDKSSDAITFTTESAVQVPNMNFDLWYSPDPELKKAVWYPYSDGGEKVWDSANPGAAKFIGSSTSPESDFVVSGKAARLESKDALVAFAAGNIYTGKFGKIAGIGAELDWGHPFTSRPSALKGYYSYEPKPIDMTNSEMSHMKGQMDKCQIQVILTDWDDVFRINTSKGQFVDIENDEHIIAFGRLETDESSAGEYKEFRIELDYRHSDRQPTYIVISACASYLGDYFTGGKGSVLYIDEFELEY